MMLPCVGFASKPFSLRATHIFQAVELSGESFISTAFNNPLPLALVTNSEGVYQQEYSLQVSDYDNRIDNDSPYYIRQEVDGIVDREAVGSEFRYFHKRGNFYSLIDYDISYSDLNIYLFRGQYNWRKDTAFSLNLDYRNSPMLFTSNALIGRTDVSTIEDLLLIRTEDEIRILAEERAGNAATLSVGVSHTFSPRYQTNADLTLAQQVFVVEDAISGSLNPATEEQIYLSAQFIASRWFNERDITVLGFRLSQTGRYDEVSLSASNRLPIKKDWKFVCPRCKTVQSAADLLEAGASKDLASSYMGFSCIGRVDKKLGCDWTLGGLFRIHTLEIVTEDEHKHPLFELAEAPV